MDTRSKIVTLAEAPRGAVLVAGIFDVLRAWHARQLHQIRGQASGLPVVAVVLSQPGAVLDVAARARMAASLRMVDYVVITNAEEFHGVAERLAPAWIVRLEEPSIGALRDAG